MRSHMIPVVLLVSSAVAQSNAITGADATAYDVWSMSAYGREGASYPNGTVAVALGHSFCNAGSVALPWSGFDNGFMIDTYPKIAYLLARQVDGRMIQVSGRSFCKHSTTPFNFGSGPCAPCQGGSGVFGIGCSDTYGPSLNSSQFRLGPTSEINPWLGTFASQGSYFDQGYPPVGGADANDNRRSPLDTTAMSVTHGRVAVREWEIGGGLIGQVQIVVVGEPGDHRGNNIVNKDATMSWNGSSWTAGTVGSARTGSVLTEWSGSTNATMRNGNDDGHIMVAVKVTDNMDGTWHYEYAVHNLDNHRGGATFRVPVDQSTQVSGIGMHDVDDDPQTDWTWARSSSDLTFLATPDNAMDWNTIFNFWFDCNVPPRGGDVEIDQARPGPGAGSLLIPSEVPDSVTSAAMQVIGTGCGGLVLASTAPPVLGTTIGLASGNVPANTLFGALLFSFRESTPALDLGLIGMPGCVYHGAGPNLSVGYSSPVGSTFTALTIPLGTALNGYRVVAQSFMYSTSLPDLGVVASNGIGLVIGP